MKVVLPFLFSPSTSWPIISKFPFFSITHNQKVLSFTEDIEGFDVTLRRVPLEDFQHNKLLDLGSSLLSGKTKKRVNIFT